MWLDNGVIGLEFDEKTGSLLAVEDRRARVTHRFDPRYARLFRVCVPDEERWIDRYADSHESGRPQMKLSKGKLGMRYPDLKTPAGESTGVSARVTVALADGADEAMLTIEVENAGPFPIHEVHFPWIGGWAGNAGPGHDRIYAGQYSFDPHALHAGGVFGRGWTIYAQHRRASPNHINMMVPMLDLSGGGRGLSVNRYPSAPRLTNVAVEDLNPRPGDARAGAAWVHHPFIKPGGKWSSDPTGLAPHGGDWHESADRLKRWLETWWRPPQANRRLRRSIGFQNPLFRDFAGRNIRPFSQLPKIAQKGIEFGIRDICVWDHTFMGAYMHAGTAAPFEESPRRLEELRKALAETNAMGVNTSTLLNTRLATMKNSLGRKYGEKWSVRTLYGMPTLESYPLRYAHSRVMTEYLDEQGRRWCQSNPEWQEWALGIVKKCCEFGFTSMFLDEPFGEDLCFATNHGHDIPAHTAAGITEWTARAAQFVRSRHEGAYTIGESLDIWTTRNIDLGWYWNWSDHHGEVFRYVLPDALQAWTVDGYEHEDEVGKAFALGFLMALNVNGLEGLIWDAPEFSRRIKRLADLRERTAHFTVDGRMMHTVGLGVDADACVVASVYDAGERLGIVLGETSRHAEKGGGKVGLELDLERHGKSGKHEVRIYREDKTVKQVRPAGSSGVLRIGVALKKWESAVVEIAPAAAGAGKGRSRK